MKILKVTSFHGTFQKCYFRCYSQGMKVTSSLNLAETIAALRSRGGDMFDVEVKSAHDGLPESLDATLCSLANRPGGGYVILRLDERNHFASVPLYAGVDVISQQIANKSRNRFSPPVVVEMTEQQVDGRSVVVIRVAECPPDQKPCRVIKTGTAYLRMNDGDYPMSLQEEQGFLAQRGAPETDTQPVSQASFEDFDPELIESWRANARRGDPHGLGKLSDTDMLYYGGICTRDGAPTVAGILALGIYPQRFFPAAIIRAAAVDPSLPTRATNDAVITGPVSTMVSQALEWAKSAFSNTIFQTPDGHSVNRSEYPLAAFREIISNAIIHREYSPWAHGIATEVRLHPTKLTVYNPGGLYGIKKEQLGVRAVSSARNPQLLSLCRYLTTGDDDRRVVEALAQGIPIVTQELANFGLPSAIFDDTGIGFTVIMKNHRALTQERQNTLESLNERQREILALISSGWATIPQLAQRLDITDMQIRRIINDLVAMGFLQAEKRPRQRALAYRVINGS